MNSVEDYNTIVDYKTARKLSEYRIPWERSLFRHSYYNSKGTLNGDAMDEVIAFTSRTMTRDERRRRMHISAPSYADVVSFFHEYDIFIWVNPVQTVSGYEWEWKIMDFLKNDRMCKCSFPNFREAMNDAINIAMDLMEDRCEKGNLEIERTLDMIEERIKKENERIIVKENSINIKDGYTYSKKTFEPVLNLLRKDYPNNNVLLNRGNCSLINEWAVHNMLYNMGLFRKHTKDVCLNYPQGFFEKTAYFMFGWFARLVIK